MRRRKSQPQFSIKGYYGGNLSGMPRLQKASRGTGLSWKGHSGRVRARGDDSSLAVDLGVVLIISLFVGCFSLALIHPGLIRRPTSFTEYWLIGSFLITLGGGWAWRVQGRVSAERRRLERPSGHLGQQESPTLDSPTLSAFIPLSLALLIAAAGSVTIVWCLSQV